MSRSDWENIGDISERFPRALSLSGNAPVAKHGARDGFTSGAREPLCFGYAHWLLYQFDVIELCGILRTFAKSRSSGPAKRSLQSMVSAMALH